MVDGNLNVNNISHDYQEKIIEKITVYYQTIDTEETTEAEVSQWAAIVGTHTYTYSMVATTLGFSPFFLSGREETLRQGRILKKLVLWELDYQ